MWNQLIEDYPPEKFRMIGIYPYTEETEIFSLAFADSIDFPLYKDPGNIRDLLQIHQTPTKILIGPYNQIRYIDGPHQQRHYQKQFYTAVRNIVGLPINRTF
ncbi:MAG: hypothetical protein K9N46_08615 [Candidatus Marinimicrobia bacterium]|nr:hypothetical protein [Candidatus Neomarinimicrobiota bacterium]MCF7880787.1 hypothetical protein [Candidatus Neomarinimicrobiota bacterium]